MRLAIIKDGVVHNVVAADLQTVDSTTNFWTKQGFVVMESSEASPGDAYENGVFTHPASTATVRILSKREFMKRLTPDEYSGIKSAAANNGQIDYLWQQFMLAEFINLDDPDTQMGVGVLVSTGLLTQDRANAVLA